MALIMPLVEFTPNLASQTEAPACQVGGGTVAEALGEVFARLPALRGYVLDDQGALRSHVVVFVDGVALRDRRTLTDSVRPDSELFVMQALSGG
jgi:molybdopterin synthase sulfur carrier subunit